MVDNWDHLHKVTEINRSFCYWHHVQVDFLYLLSVAALERVHICALTWLIKYKQRAFVAVSQVLKLCQESM